MLPSVTISLYRNGGSDIVGPSNAVYTLLDEIDGIGVFENIDIQIIQDDAVTVRQDLADVLENAFSGLLIVVLVLYLFLGLREALITSLIINDRKNNRGRQGWNRKNWKISAQNRKTLLFRIGTA
jgi:HAE1 family hydrophobic/amphiphilic exporter-1